MPNGDTCGYIKDDGDPCQLPASRSDGRCHHHTEAEEQKRGGRPSKLEEHKQDILTGARQGMTLQGCARLAGVPEQTLHRWIKKYDDFRESLNRARAQGELKHLQNVNDAGSRFVLERSFGYTKEQELELSGGEQIGGLSSDDKELLNNLFDRDPQP